MNDITSPPSQWINVLEVNSNGDFFAATSDGLFHSTNNGSSWNLITFPFAGFKDINELKIASNNYIYVPFYSLNVSSLLRSTDNGNTWSEIRSALGFISSIEEDQNGNILGEIKITEDKSGFWLERTSFVSALKRRINPNQVKSIKKIIAKSAWKRLYDFDPELNPWYCPKCRRPPRCKLTSQTITALAASNSKCS